MKTCLRYSLLLLCIHLVSCKTYFDKKIGKVGILDGYLMSNKKHNQLVYEAKKTFKSDTETITPTFYSLKLPKRIKRFFVGRLGMSWVDYGDNQFIIIVENVESNSSGSNILTEEDWREKVIANFEIGELSKLSLDSFQLINNRTSMILNKDKVSIILYNIKNRDFKTLVDDIRSAQIVNASK